MRRNFLKMAFVAVIVTVIGTYVFNAQKSEGLSDVALANVEALAGGDDGNWYCVGDAWLCFFDMQVTIFGEYHTIDQEGPKD